MRKRITTYSTHRQRTGAGDGNRTHIASLEGWSSTIELHPPVHFVLAPALPMRAPPPEPARRPPRFLAIAQRWWRAQDSNLRRHPPADLQSAAFHHSAPP